MRRLLVLFLLLLVLLLPLLVSCTSYLGDRDSADYQVVSKGAYNYYYVDSFAFVGEYLYGYKDNGTIIMAIPARDVFRVVANPRREQK